MLGPKAGPKVIRQDSLLLKSPGTESTAVGNLLPAPTHPDLPGCGLWEMRRTFGPVQDGQSHGILVQLYLILEP